MENTQEIQKNTHPANVKHVKPKHVKPKHIRPTPNPNGVYISTYGCQMNVNDSERMLSLLEMSNFTEVKTPEEASLIIINSCSVREKPVHKVHSEAGRYAKLKKRNPELMVGVGGCVGQQEKGSLLKDVPTLNFVFGPDNIDVLPELVLKVREEKQKVSNAKFEAAKPYQIETLVRNPGVATFVNIMKGCDNFCSFCIVPFTRGRERSRLMNEIISDIQKLVQRGVKEVTLLGQNVNSYKSDGGVTFLDLLKNIIENTTLERIRYTSPHPKDYNQELMEFSQKHRDRICDYIHMPAQSGSSRILQLMNRNYTREEYIEKIKMIRKIIPGVSISTDLIVGFPGETEEDFEDTLNLLREVKFDQVFAFAYSSRPYTKAAKMDGHLSEVVKKERLNKLFDVQDEISFEECKKLVGQTMQVLVEKVDQYDAKLLMGRSSQNRLMHFEGPESLIGQTVPVRVIKAFPVNLKGELITS